MTSHDLRRDLPALGLLALEAASTVLGAWFVLGGDALGDYLVSNALPLARRLTLLGTMFGAGATVVAVALALWRLGRLSAERIEQIARRLCPLALLGLATPLFRFRAFVGHELTFVCLLSIVVLALIPALDLALRAPALLPLRVRAWQAPLPRSETGWTMLAAACAVAYAAYFSFHTVRGHHNLVTTSFDLGLEENVLWNIVHGGHLFKASPMAGGPVGGYAGEHMPFIAYLLAPLYALYQHAATLLVLQSFLIAAGALPLFAFARRHIEARFACALAICFLLSPAVHGPNLYDFHYLTLAPLFVWAAWWALDARRDRLAALLVPLALCVREDVAADMVIVGLVLVCTRARPRAGALVALVSAAYFVVVRFLLIPRFASVDAFAYIYTGLQPEGMPTVAGALATLLSNPVFTLEKILIPEKLLYALQLLAPLAFVPLRRPLALLLLLPAFFFTLLTTGYAPTVQITFQYATHWTLFLFPGAVLALAVAGPATRRACLGAILLGTLAASSQFGAVLHPEQARGGFGPYPMNSTAGDRERYAALQELLALVHADAAVVATEAIVPHLSNRAYAYSLDTGPFDAQIALVEIDRIYPGEREMLVRMLRSGEFGLVLRNRFFMMLRRGAPTEGNARLLEQMQGER